jgi:3-hydroxyacyl-CoA dehydrogenase/enoyl-CoA hydratase/carnithine racemase
MSDERPEEVVTEAKVRIIDLPLGAGRCALITLDNGKDHTRPSTFGPAGLASLDAALDTVAATPDLSAVAITGKPFIFAVGADLSAIGQVTDPEIVHAFAQLGHRVFGRITDLGLPSFAFVNGAAMGGGLELALNCHYRTISTSAAAVSLPEVFLGLIPGWGGAWLVPNLIGPERAIDVIVQNPLAQNRQLKPADVLRLGLADAMFEGADFLEQSLKWAAQVIRGDVQVERNEPDRDTWSDIVDAARKQLDARLHGATPAPYVALDLIDGAKTRTRDEGFAAEDQALTDLVMGNDLRASLYAFDLVQKRAKRPVGVPDASLALPVNKVGVVGAGLMASQLALLFAKRLQVPVVLTDLDQERVDKGVAYVHADIDGQIAKGRMTQDRGNRLKALVTGSTDKAIFADADFVIEAVFENLDVKKTVFAELEGIVSPTCILATNTSSLSVSAMAADLTHPERVVGFHFFNPVALMPLLEIARAKQTNDETLATAFAVGKALKKSCVLVQDAPAFVVNRLLTRFLAEVTRAVDEGADFMTADRALEPLGLPMSPFNLLALVGPAVAFHVSETMHEAFPDRFYVSENMRRMVDAGKTAIYVWDESGQPQVDPEIAAMFQQGTADLSADEIRERAVNALADEARRMLDEGVVAEAQDLDLCMLLGAGWPFALGGLTPYLDRVGASESVTGSRFLPPGVASVAA